MPIKNRTHFKEEGNLPSDSGGIPLEAGILLGTSSLLRQEVSTHLLSKLNDLTAALGDEISEKSAEDDKLHLEAPSGCQGCLCW